jgi:hypothetical protein
MGGLDFTQGAKFLGTEVTIKLNDGRSVSRHITEGFSIPGIENDAPHPELINKFVRYANKILPNRNISSCIECIKNLDTLANVSSILDEIRVK